MRRVGKTTTLRWLLDQVTSTNKIFLDLERLDQRAVFQESNYELVLNYFRNLGMDPNQPLTVALDEIHSRLTCRVWLNIFTTIIGSNFYSRVPVLFT
jgi:predicted AAA+ superfamily ATPase